MPIIVAASRYCKISDARHLVLPLWTRDEFMQSSWSTAFMPESSNLTDTSQLFLEFDSSGPRPFTVVTVLSRDSAEFSEISTEPEEED